MSSVRDHSCSWPQEGLSSKSWSLCLASFFFLKSLALASSVRSSTPPLLLIPVSYCSLLRRIKNIPVRILYNRNGTSIKSVSLLVAWFGLCFSKYFTPGNVLGWTNLLGYRYSLTVAVSDWCTHISDLHSQKTTSEYMYVTYHKYQSGAYLGGGMVPWPPFGSPG